MHLIGVLPPPAAKVQDEVMNDGARPESADRREAASRRTPLVVGLGLLVLLAIVAVVAVVVAGNDEPEYVASIDRVQQACQDWRNSAQAPSDMTRGWCDSMAGWMDSRADQASDGSMMGSMFWRDPDAMRSTCEQWMRSSPDSAPAGVDSSTWCNRMVNWMDQHTDGWGDEMMGGS